MLHCLLNKFHIAVRTNAICKLPHVSSGYARRSARLSVSWARGQRASRMFRLCDYDCVGFDLDNTLLRYKIGELVALEYEVMARFLVERGYDAGYLLRPLGADVDFLQKGLVLDFERGNVLQLARGGAVAKASHGTRPMTDADVRACYGEQRRWDVADMFHRDPLSTWNGPLERRMRSLLDYFDAPASLVFGRIVDSLDAREGRALPRYDVWPDVLDALCHMFGREQFAANGGDYFPALKRSPDKFIRKCSRQVVDWLRELKRSKVVFLVTGSNVDFASFTARNCLGEDWRDLFDVVVCYARKPGFFTGNRPFLRLEGIRETEELTADRLEFGNMYSQGNWQDLFSLFEAKTGKQQPKCVYFGDNLIQDVYTPNKSQLCDVVAVVEELLVESPGELRHPDEAVLTSKLWGPYLQRASPSSTLWSEFVHKYAKLCVSDLDVLARNPLTFPFSCIDPLDPCSSLGYHISEHPVDC
ncbi:5'-nucleotidase domain-containing protein 1 [Bacillus rossius redtenbacheri]|uniref:5'-nucleotidase domain-containing protein 1 n=1 Tax=Bacillus rossius redtenbacheri TaxID=93214 RepID=UPI002FDEACF4